MLFFIKLTEVIFIKVWNKYASRIFHQNKISLQDETLEKVPLRDCSCAAFTYNSSFTKPLILT